MNPWLWPPYTPPISRYYPSYPRPIPRPFRPYPRRKAPWARGWANNIYEPFYEPRPRPLPPAWSLGGRGYYGGRRRRHQCYRDGEWEDEELECCLGNYGYGGYDTSPRYYGNGYFALTPPRNPYLRKPKRIGPRVRWRHRQCRRYLC